MSSKTGHSSKKGTKFQIKSSHARRFSEEFKRSKVKEILAKRIRVSEFCKLYGVSPTSVYNWIYKYSDLEKGTRQVIEMESEAHKTKKLLEQVAKLERKIGQQQLEIDYLKKTLELASEEVGYDLKKKYATRS